MISAVLIVKDEARVLQQTLEVLREVVDEIVVADTGSQDKTVTIAGSLADVVFVIDWREDFSEARNCAIAKATGDWILSIDADEVISEPNTARRQLTDFASRYSPQTTGSIEVVSVTFNNGQQCSTSSHMQRFFHRTSVRFEGAIHEQLVPYTGELSRARTHVVVDHSGYAHDPADPAHKAWRNIPLLQSALKQDPENEYYRYQLGQAYFTVGQFDAAADSLQHMLDSIRFENLTAPMGRSGAVPREILTTAITSLAYAQVNRQRIDDARALVDRHKQLAHVGTRWADFQHVCGHVGFMQGDIDYAKAGYAAAIECGPNSEDVGGTGSYASAYHLGLLAEVECKPLSALEQYVQSLVFKADYLPALNRLVDCMLENNFRNPGNISDVTDMQPLRKILANKRERYRQTNDISLVHELDGIAAKLPHR